MSKQSNAWKQRIAMLHTLISRGHMATREAAQFADGDRRKALDHFKRLEEAGVPLFKRGTGRDLQWVLEEGWRATGGSVRLQDHLALLFGRDLVDSVMPDTDFSTSLAGYEQRLRALDPQLDSTLDLSRRFFVKHEPEKPLTEAQRGMLSALSQAILAGHRVDFSYTRASTGELQECRGIAPYSIVLYKRGVYLGTLQRGKFRLFAFERIAGLTIRPDLSFTYPRPGEYDPQAILATRFGITDNGKAGARNSDDPVRLRFDADATTYVTGRIWHHSQRIIETEDGGCILELTVAGPEIESLILQFGHRVEVLGPAKLRQTIIETYRKALSKHHA